LRTDNLDAAVALATLPDEVRGYEQLKLDSGTRFLSELGRARQTIGI
jgi:indolepyruvate ferredoxin oxidoreductase